MRLAEQLIGEEEGPQKPHVYKDSRGFWTISRGCLVDPAVPCEGLCQAAMDAQNAHDSAKAVTAAQSFPGYAQMNEVRQAVLESMCFQMGTAPLHWPNFHAALVADDMQAAAIAGLDSDWARTETPTRAKREMAMLASGIWINHGDII